MNPYPHCSPKRYGKMGVMHCPHGCVTECALLAVCDQIDQALDAGDLHLAERLNWEARNLARQVYA